MEDTVYLLGSGLKKIKTETVGSATVAGGRSRVHGLVQAVNNVLSPDIRNLGSTGDVNRGTSETHFLSVLQQDFDESLLE